MRTAAAKAALAALAPLAASALTLELPPLAVPLADREAAFDSHFIATAPYRGEGEAEGVVAEGAVRQRSWRVGEGGLTTLQILAPLRDQLREAGYAVLFECDARDCGGFDFRFRLEALPAPDMHVDLGDFRYLSANRTEGGEDEFASLLVSRSANSGFVQLTTVGQPETAPETMAEPSSAVPVGRRLEREGFAALDGLVFRTGSAELEDARPASLDELAAYLRNMPDARIILVGHTDAGGTLDANVALSRLRAEAVAGILIERFGIDPDRVSAEGVGFLAPRFSILAEGGRRRNRRVEAVLLIGG